MTEQTGQKNNRLGMILGVVGVGCLILGLFVGCSSSNNSPLEIMRGLESTAKKLSPGSDGAVLATIEDEEITRKLFDLQLSLFLKTSGRASPEEILRMKNNPDFLKQFLRQLVDNRIILLAMESDPDFKDNPELAVFLHLTLADGLQKYYLYKKTGSMTVNTNVTDTEIETTYNQLRADPRYAERLDRVPFDQLKEMLSQEIVQQRRLVKIRESLDKEKGKYRINLYDEIFGDSTGQTNSLSLPGILN